MGVDFIKRNFRSQASHAVSITLQPRSINISTDICIICGIYVKGLSVIDIEAHWSVHHTQVSIVF